MTCAVCSVVTCHVFSVVTRPVFSAQCVVASGVQCSVVMQCSGRKLARSLRGGPTAALGGSAVGESRKHRHCDEIMSAATSPGNGDIVHMGATINDRSDNKRRQNAAALHSHCRRHATAGDALRGQISMHGTRKSPIHMPRVADILLSVMRVYRLVNIRLRPD